MCTTAFSRERAWKIQYDVKRRRHQKLPRYETIRRFHVPRWPLRFLPRVLVVPFWWWTFRLNYQIRCRWKSVFPIRTCNFRRAVILALLTCMLLFFSWFSHCRTQQSSGTYSISNQYQFFRAVSETLCYNVESLLDFTPNNAWVRIWGYEWYSSPGEQASASLSPLVSLYRAEERGFLYRVQACRLPQNYNRRSNLQILSGNIHAHTLTHYLQPTHVNYRSWHTGQHEVRTCPVWEDHCPFWSKYPLTFFNRMLHIALIISKANWYPETKISEKVRTCNSGYTLDW